MTFRFKNARLLILPVILLGMAGCTQNPTSTSPSSGNLLKGVAGAFLAARSFDQATVALQNGNDQQLKSVGESIRKAAAKSGNSSITVLTATQLTYEAGVQNISGLGITGYEKTQILNENNRKYRFALSVLPTDYQKISELNLDDNTLNTLGYFLADRGETSKDFQMAEFLTSASLAQLDRIGKSLPADDPRIPSFLFSRAIGPGDSKAWALFKQKRYAEARSQQEDVLQTLIRYSEPAKERMSADIPFHLAEIYLALGELSMARSCYTAALSLGPDAELQEKIESRLLSLKNSIAA